MRRRRTTHNTIARAATHRVRCHFHFAIYTQSSTSHTKLMRVTSMRVFVCACISHRPLRKKIVSMERENKNAQSRINFKGIFYFHFVCCIFQYLFPIYAHNFLYRYVNELSHEKYIYKNRCLIYWQWEKWLQNSVFLFVDVVHASLKLVALKLAK